MKVIWAHPALRDLEAIGDYVAKNDPAAAALLINRILDQADTLKQYPESGRPGRVPGTREKVIIDTPFVVPYRVRDKRVEILAVFHGAREWPEEFKA